VLLMSMKSQILSVSFRTQRRSDVEPPSGAECVTARWRAAERGKPQSTQTKARQSRRGCSLDGRRHRIVKLKPKGVDDVEDEVVCSVDVDEVVELYILKLAHDEYA
jgi:hypothetical protein